jgi:holo-[acyl-carrier protein] synthase
MIVGIGTDIVSVERIRKLRDAAVSRVLTGAEEAYCRRHADPAERIAGRFAAKEAILKAFGTGLAKGMSWRQIEILPDEKGAPIVSFSGKAASQMRTLGANRCHLSISHDGGRAVAFVLLEWREDLS